MAGEQTEPHPVQVQPEYVLSLMAGEQPQPHPEQVQPLPLPRHQVAREDDHQEVRLPPADSDPWLGSDPLGHWLSGRWVPWGRDAGAWEDEVAGENDGLRMEVVAPENDGAVQLLHSGDDDTETGEMSWTSDDNEEYMDIGLDDAYANGGFGAVPASSEAIAGLPDTTVGETREEQCMVCLEGFAAGDKLRRMPCAHGFHESCIFRWLRASRVCPLCRFTMPDEYGSETD